MAKTAKARKAKADKKPAGPKVAQKKVKVRQQIRKGPHGGVQLVLIEDVTYLGKQGDLVEVKPGYARNYLLPNSLATMPSAHNLRLLERYKVRVQQAREAKMADLKVLAEQIQRISITIESNATEEGHLYGSVDAPQIAKALAARNLPVEADMVKLEGPIKELGLYAVTLSLGYEIPSEVK